MRILKHFQSYYLLDSLWLDTSSATSVPESVCRFFTPRVLANVQTAEEPATASVLWADGFITL